MEIVGIHTARADYVPHLRVWSALLDPVLSRRLVAACDFRERVRLHLGAAYLSA